MILQRHRSERSRSHVAAISDAEPVSRDQLTAASSPERPRRHIGGVAHDVERPSASYPERSGEHRTALRASTQGAATALDQSTQPDEQSPLIVVGRPRRPRRDQQLHHPDTNVGVEPRNGQVVAHVTHRVGDPVKHSVHGRRTITVQQRTDSVDCEETDSNRTVLAGSLACVALGQQVGRQRDSRCAETSASQHHSVGHLVAGPLRHSGRELATGEHLARFRGSLQPHQLVDQRSAREQRRAIRPSDDCGQLAGVHAHAHPKSLAPGERCRQPAQSGGHPQRHVGSTAGMIVTLEPDQRGVAGKPEHVAAQRDGRVEQRCEAEIEGSVQHLDPFLPGARQRLGEPSEARQIGQHGAARDRDPRLGRGAHGSRQVGARAGCVHRERSATDSHCCRVDGRTREPPVCGSPGHGVKSSSRSSVPSYVTHTSGDRSE